MRKTFYELSVAFVFIFLLSSLQQIAGYPRTAHASHENIPIDRLISSHGCAIIGGKVITDTIDYVEPERIIEICNYDDKYYFRTSNLSSGLSCPGAVGYWTDPQSGFTFVFSSICDVPHFYEYVSCSGSEIQIRTGEKPFYVLLESSNSSCNTFDLDKAQKRITMNIYAKNQDNRMNVTIPNELLGGKFGLMIDMGSTEEFLVDDEAGYSTISFSKFCPAGCHYQADIFGTEVTSFELLQYSPPSNNAPLIMNAKGDRIQQLHSGQQVIIFGNYRSTTPQDVQPYLMILEIRDDRGVTQFIAWQSGVAEPDRIATVGVSWVPETRGLHHVRVAVISAFDNPVLLYPPVTYNVVVS